MRCMHGKLIIQLERKIYTCEGTTSTDGAGASQIHRGIPHLHSLTPTTSWCSTVGSAFESISTSSTMFNLETPSDTDSTPFEEACTLSFTGLWPKRIPPFQSQNRGKRKY